MNNVQLEIVSEHILILRVDLSRDISYTNSNQSIRIASTGGNLLLWHDGQPHPKGIKLNLNVFRSLTTEERKKVKEARKKSNFY